MSTALSRSATARRQPGSRGRGWRKPYWTVLPALLCLLALSLYPVIHLVWLSLHNVRIVPGASAEFIGLRQYGWILSDSEFWTSMRVTGQFVASAALLELLLGLGIALLLNFDGPYVGALRMLFLLPTFLAPVVVALAWSLLFNAELGLVNYALSFLGVAKQPWLARPETAMAGLVVADVWQWTPFMMLLILAGLRSLPTEPYEAAATDGASPWQAFWYITLPLIWPVMAVALLIRALDAVKVFGLALVLTGGGPGIATNVLGLYIFRKAFEQHQLEYASGVAVLLFLITFSVAAAYSVMLLRGRAEAA